MAHEKVYGICEDMCQVEVYPKTETYSNDEVDGLLGGKSNTNHNHDLRYYKKVETDALFGFTNCTIEQTMLYTGITLTYVDYSIRYYPSLNIYTLRLHVQIDVDTGYDIPAGQRVRVGSIKKGSSYISDVIKQTLAAGTLAGDSSTVDRMAGAYIKSNGDVYVYFNEALTANGVTKEIGISGIIPATV